MFKTHIIGFCGKAGVGKGEASRIIVDMDPNIPVKVFPLAAELKRIASQEFGWGGEKDEKGRKLLQTLGTECGRMYGGESFWVNKWESKVRSWLDEHANSNRDEYPIVICDDVRFDNEAQRIIDLDGTIVHLTGRAYDMGENSGHVSEKGINPDLITYTIVNDGTLNQFESLIKKCLKSIGVMCV